MLEKVIQSKTIQLYKKNGWIVNKILQCTLNGWPDLECYKDNKIVFIETKAPGKSPRPLQLYRHKQLSDAGFTVFVFNSLEQIKLP